jgi:hypothetical protein
MINPSIRIKKEREAVFQLPGQIKHRLMLRYQGTLHPVICLMREKQSKPLVTNERHF